MAPRTGCPVLDPTAVIANDRSGAGERTLMPPDLRMNRDLIGMATLKIVTGGEAGRKIAVPVGEMILGRQVGCHAVIADPTVSRRHAKFFWDGQKLSLYDLSSQNGSFLNGERVDHAQALRSGDLVYLGEVGLLVDLPDLKTMPVDIQFLPLEGRASSQRPESGSGVLVTSRSATAEPAGQSGRAGTAADLGRGSSQASRAEQKLAAILELTRNVGSSLDPHEVLPELLDSVLRIFPQAERGAVFAADMYGKLQLEAARDRRLEGAKEFRPMLSETLWSRVIEQGTPVLSADVAQDAQFQGSSSMFDMNLRSLICAPLKTPNQRVVGLVWLDTAITTGAFSENDIELLSSVAGLMGLVVEFSRLHTSELESQRRAADLDLAALVQRTLLPHRRPAVPGYSFYDFYSSAQEVGGDYYDYVTLADGRLAIPLADVSGKGVSAALLMSRLSADVRQQLVQSSSAGAFLTALNRNLCDGRSGRRFVTMSICLLDPVRHVLQLGNAGHIPPYFYERARAEVCQLNLDDIAGPPLGVHPDWIYGQIELPLAVGDCLFEATDGVFEAPLEQGVFGLQPPAVLGVAARGRAEEWGMAVVDQVLKSVADQTLLDDICVVCFGRNDGAGVSSQTSDSLPIPDRDLLGFYEGDPDTDPHVPQRPGSGG